MGLLDSGCCVDARCRRERLPSVPFDWRHHGAVTFCERALVVPAKSSAAGLDVESTVAHSLVRIGSAKASVFLYRRPLPHALQIHCN